MFTVEGKVDVEKRQKLTCITRFVGKTKKQTYLQIVTKKWHRVSSIVNKFEKSYEHFKYCLNNWILTVVNTIFQMMCSLVIIMHILWEKKLKNSLKEEQEQIILEQSISTLLGRPMFVLRYMPAYFIAVQGVFVPATNILDMTINYIQ